MLTALRSKSSKFVLKILFALLIVSFAVWGIGDIFRGGGRSVDLIEVGPQAITQVELQNEYNRQINQLRQVYGSSIDTETARALGLVNRVVNDVIARGLFAVYTHRIGMRVGDAAVRQMIQGDTSFRNDLGQFDRNRFEAWLSRNGMSEAMLVARLRNDIARGQLTTSLVAGVQAPQTLVGAIHDHRSEERVAETLRIVATDMTGVATPDDAALQTFYEAHAEDYQAPEYRAVTLLRLSPEDLAKEIRVGDEEVEAAFAARKAEFDVAEKRHLDQIVFSDQAAAQAAAEKLAAGGDFAAIAKEATGGDPIDLGTVDKAGLARTFPQLADAAFAAPEGQATAPTETMLGWHLVRVLSVEPGREATLAEFRDEVAHDLALEQAHDSIVSIANQLEDELAGGATLDEAAAALDLSLTGIAALDSTGKDPAGNAVPAAAEPGLAEAAFAAEAGEVSPLTDAADGGYYMLRVDDITPAATRPFAEVREQVTADWLSDAWAKAAAEKATAIIERLNAGESLATIATELGTQPSTSKPVMRDGSDVAANLPAAIVPQLFTLKQGEVAAVADGGDQIILRLVEIRAPTDGGDPAATADLRQSLRGELANDVVNQFMAALQQEIDVSVNNEAIDQLF
jgi:peptidyl-prolyl cis-trans isomerase D